MDQSVPEVTAFSTIKFFPMFQEAIGKINEYPLQKENIVVQIDAYQRLAAHEEEIDDYEPFASLECNRKESDSAMRFAFELGAEFCSLEIEGAGRVYFDYSHCFKDEKDAVKQIVECLRMLSNGQIACLLTFRDGQWCASELLVYDQASRVPHVIATEAKYPWRWRKNDVQGYETQVLRNNYLKDQIKLPEEAFLYIRDHKGQLPRNGRSFTKPEITPLTKELYNTTMEEIGMALAGKRPDESEWLFLYRSWEFWVNILIAIGLVFGGAALGFLPTFILSYPIVAVLPIGFVVSYITFLQLARKEQLKHAQPDHPWLKLDGFMQRIGRLFRRKKKDTKKHVN